MLKSSRSLVILGLLAVLVWPPAGTVAGAGGPPHAGTQAPQAPSAAAWYDGLIQYSTITNCASIIFPPAYQEYGAATYVGFMADPNNSQPAPSATYYAHVVIYGLGNSCSGMRAYIDLALPANTSLAISGAHPVYCFYDGAARPTGLPPGAARVQHQPRRLPNPFIRWRPRPHLAHTPGPQP